MSDLRSGDLQPLEPNSIANFFAENGPLADQMDGYESRPSQQSMAAHVAMALNRGDTLAVRALALNHGRKLPGPMSKKYLNSGPTIFYE